jgi:hypothetical protein
MQKKGFLLIILELFITVIMQGQIDTPTAVLKDLLGRKMKQPPVRKYISKTME